MTHVCRICEKTLQRARPLLDFSTALADIVDLDTRCVEIEMDLYDSFNAFCFKCRNITMSVPGGVSVNEQVCYLRSQIICFEALCSHGLIATTSSTHDTGAIVAGAARATSEMFDTRHCLQTEKVE